MIDRFTKENLRQLRSRLDPVLAEIGKEFGINLTSGNISFSVGEFTLKVKGMATSAEAQADRQESHRRMASIMGLDPALLGKVFTHKGHQVKIVGFDPRKPKFPVICDDLTTGKSMKYTEASIRILVAKEA